MRLAPLLFCLAAALLPAEGLPDRFRWERGPAARWKVFLAGDREVARRQYPARDIPWNGLEGMAIEAMLEGGEDLLGRGEADEAVRLLRQALAQLERHQENSVGAAEIHLALGHAERIRGNLAEAADHLREGLALRERHRGEDAFELIEPLEQLATTTLDQRDLRAALHALQRLRDLRRKHKKAWRAWCKVAWVGGAAPPVRQAVARATASYRPSTRTPEDPAPLAPAAPLPGPHRVASLPRATSASPGSPTSADPAASAPGASAPAAQALVTAPLEAPPDMAVPAAPGSEGAPVEAPPTLADAAPADPGTPQALSARARARVAVRAGQEAAARGDDDAARDHFEAALTAIDTAEILPSRELLEAYAALLRRAGELEDAVAFETLASLPGAAP